MAAPPSTALDTVRADVVGSLLRPDVLKQVYARHGNSQAKAEELRVAVEKVNLILADTALAPNDGITAGSRTTPATVPAVRNACATARKLLDDFISHSPVAKNLTYADLASDEKFLAAARSIVAQAVPTAPLVPAEKRLPGKLFAADAKPTTDFLPLSYYKAAKASHAGPIKAMDQGFQFRGRFVFNADANDANVQDARSLGEADGETSAAGEQADRVHAG